MDRRRFNPIVDNASTSGKCPWYNKKNSNPNNKNVGIHSTTICSQSQYGMQGMEEPHILEKKKDIQKKKLGIQPQTTGVQDWRVLCRKAFIAKRKKGGIQRPCVLRNVC
jgi:hypothetical protein